jgi:hypothetical protein
MQVQQVKVFSNKKAVAACLQQVIPAVPHKLTVHTPRHQVSHTE